MSQKNVVKTKRFLAAYNSYSCLPEDLVTEKQAEFLRKYGPLIDLLGELVSVVLFVLLVCSVPASIAIAQTRSPWFGVLFFAATSALIVISGFIAAKKTDNIGIVNGYYEPINSAGCVDLESLLEKYPSLLSDVKRMYQVRGYVLSVELKILSNMGNDIFFLTKMESDRVAGLESCNRIQQMAGL